VLFRKLCDEKPTLADLAQSHPMLARSLRQLLAYEQVRCACVMRWSRVMMCVRGAERCRGRVRARLSLLVRVVWRAEAL
jgi:hypothetical protein